MQKLAATWEDFFSGFQCSLPDKDAETMINIWNPYQMERNFPLLPEYRYYAHRVRSAASACATPRRMFSP